MTYLPGIRMHDSLRVGKQGGIGQMSRALSRGDPPPYNARMLSLVFGTIAFFAASYFIKRYLDEIGIPKTLVRGLVVFVLALAAAYGVAFVVERAAGLAG
jgi:hypothetical protein